MFGMGQSHHRGRAVGVVQHHDLGRVVLEHHGDFHFGRGVQLETPGDCVALIEWLMT